MYWKQLEAFVFFPYLVVATQGDTHRGKYTHSYLVMPPRARLLHNICPTFIWPDAASQRELNEEEEERERGGGCRRGGDEGERTQEKGEREGGEQ